MSDENVTATTTSVEKYNDLFSQGDLWFWKCEYKKAKEHFQTILNQPSLNLLDLARCYSSLGAVNAKLQNYEEALNNYHEQLDILLKLDMSEQKENNIAKCNMSIGKIYWLKEDYVRAIEYYKKTLLESSISIVSHDLISNIHKGLANLYTKTREFDLARMHFENALQRDCHQLGKDHPKFGQTYANMGAMYYAKQDYQEAMNYFKQARETWLKSLPSSHVYIESMEKTICTVQSKLVLSFSTTMSSNHIQELIDNFIDPEAPPEISSDQYIQKHNELLQSCHQDEFKRIVQLTLQQCTKDNQTEQNTYLSARRTIDDTLNEDKEKEHVPLEVENKEEIILSKTSEHQPIIGSVTDVSSIYKCEQLLQLLYSCQYYNEDCGDLYIYVLNQYMKSENEKIIRMTQETIISHIFQNTNNNNYGRFVQRLLSYMSVSTGESSFVSTDTTEEAIMCVMLLTDINIHYPYTARFLDAHREFRDCIQYFIDGDSLLLSIAHHINVNLELYGGNTLHVIYIIERILLTLFNQSHENNYTIVFFDCHFQLYQQSNSILTLIRTGLIVHLLKNTNQYNGIKIHQFSSWLSDEYLTLTREEKPLFIFYHDLSTFDINNDKLLPKDILTKLLYIYRLFGNYHQYIIQCHLYLMNKLILTETSVQCFQIKFRKQFPLDLMKKIDNLMYESNLIAEKEQDRNEFKKFCQQIGQRDGRLFLYLKTITDLIEQGKEQNRSESLWPLFVLHMALLIRLSLADRHLLLSPSSIKFGPTFIQLVAKFQQQLSSNILLCSSDLSWLKVADLFDGRLFAVTLEQIHRSVSSIHFDSDTLETVQKCLDILKIPWNENLFQNLIHRMVETGDISFSSVVCEQQRQTCQQIAKISNDFIDTYLKPIYSLRNQGIFELVEPNNIQVPRYEGRHHWHVYKEVGNEINRIPDSSKQSNSSHRYRTTNQQKKANYFTVYGKSLTTPDVKDNQLQIVLPISSSSASAGEENSACNLQSSTVSVGKTNRKHKGQSKSEKIKEENMKRLLNKLDDAETDSMNNIVAQLKQIQPSNYSERIEFINNSLSGFTISAIRLQLLKQKSDEQRKYLKVLRQRICSGKDERSKLESLEIELFATMAEIIHLENVVDAFTETKQFMMELIDDPLLDREKWYRFQMEKINSRLPRREQGKADDRLPGLLADEWQVQFLDAVDQQQSIIIVAPTASGKTYASYYAMNSVLKKKYGGDGICVYVAPSKALVNQVAATILSKFGPVFGIFTRDFRENVDDCKILVTVPQCLEILLLSSSYQSWCQKIQYCIFDEIHCMSGEAGSEVWERIMSLINAPMIGLSATINNGENLQKWIETVEHERSVLNSTYISRKVCFISHDERLADLNKYLYSNKNLNSLHPIGVMDAKQLTTRGIPKDFSLSPRETLQLKDELEKNGIGNEQIPTLTEYFSPNWIIERNLCNKYSHLVRKQFDTLIKKKKNFTIDSVIKSLAPSSKISYPEEKSIPSLIIDFMLTLQEKNLLPCIVFCDDRRLCEQMAESVANYFTQLECTLRNTKYKAQIEDIEKKLKAIKKFQQTAQSPSERNNKKGRGDDAAESKAFDEDSNNQAQLSGHEQQLLDGILNECNLVNSRGCDQKEINTLLEKAEEDYPKLVNYMKRGIAYHHAGLNNRGRVAVEALFRSRYVQLIFSTSTLSLGIHMPTKTVAFVKDSIFLDALQYRQSSGRAGRRGFDIQGHIVFINIPIPKIRHLIISSIPDIHPHSPISLTFLMRLLHLCSAAKGKDIEYAINRSLIALQCPFIAQSAVKHDLIKIQLQYHCLHTLHFLHQLNLIDGKGALVGLAGLSTHLYYHEPANLFLVYLMNAQLFHRLDDDDDIVSVLARLFTTMPWLITYKTYEDLSSTRREKMYNSKLFLPPVSHDFSTLVHSYNSVVKEIYGFYIENVIRHLRSLNEYQVEVLPFSNVSFYSSSDYDNGSFEYDLHHSRSQQSKNPSISPFAGLSGLTHEQFMLNYNPSVGSWDLAYDLDLSPRIIPFIDIDARDHTNSAYYLNSYALDFFKHGSETSLIKENDLKPGDIYNLLLDFFLTLSSIKTSLQIILDNENKQVTDNDAHFFQPLFEKISRIREIYSKKFYKQYPNRKAV
ncbi:unnamed protein product [Adineta steineri]|uniref:Uncharacterized protein n=1 Tax=Adineta steineri TaxID=433720 RepID=A0A814UXY7_9BILA|nr:unnamed protein product [Adineta steineri]